MRIGRRKRHDGPTPRWEPPRGPFPEVVVHAGRALDLAGDPPARATG